MKIRVPSLLTAGLACALIFASTNLVAQQGARQGRVPVGPPGFIGTEPFSVPNGPLPAVNPTVNPTVAQPFLTLQIGQSYDGIDFLGSNCGCLPPDTNAAVGNNFVVETVNVQVRVFDKITGAVLLDEPLSALFGAPTGGDPYVEYDDIAGRWYVTAFDSNDAGLFLAVSNDSNPLDGFQTYDLTNVGGFPDYQKIGYTKDAIFISYNDFGAGGGFAAIAAIDKTAILSGSLVYYVSVPAPQFRAMPPAQMHGDTLGGTEWFVSTDGTDAGGTTIRVTKMNNYLSNAPIFTYTSLPVNQYRQARRADQPGGPGSVTVFPNTTTAQVQFRRGHLVTAMASALAKDGFNYPKGLYYVINVATPTPTLLKQGLIDHGFGSAIQMVSVDEDSKRHLGLNWVESSSTEYLSMWVGTKRRIVKIDVAPGLGFFSFGSRIGDYSTTVVDPSDGLTFWSANETIGSDGNSDIWKTHITSFTEQ